MNGLTDAITSLKTAASLEELCELLNDISNEFVGEDWDAHGFAGGRDLPIFCKSISFDEVGDDCAFSWDWDGYLVHNPDLSSGWQIVPFSKDSSAYVKRTEIEAIQRE